jgi:hypothetical protein
MDEVRAWTARAAITELITRYAVLNDAARPRRASRHIVANVLVTLEGETRARASSQILLFTGSAAEDGDPPIQSTTRPLIGSYDDTLVKTTDGWRFTERRGRLDFLAR